MPAVAGVTPLEPLGAAQNPSEDHMRTPTQVVVQSTRSSGEAQAVVRYKNSAGQDVILRSMVLDTFKNHYMNLFIKHRNKIEMEKKKQKANFSAPDSSLGIDLSVKNHRKKLKEMQEV